MGWDITEKSSLSQLHQPLSVGSSTDELNARFDPAQGAVHKLSAGAHGCGGAATPGLATAEAQPLGRSCQGAATGARGLRGTTTRARPSGRGRRGATTRAHGLWGMELAASRAQPPRLVASEVRPPGHDSLGAATGARGLRGWPPVLAAAGARQPR